jgi:hypothetical protein
MSVLSALHVLALILGSAILFSAAVFGAIFVLAYFGRRPGYSYFDGRVTVPEANDDDNHSV